MREGPQAAADAGLPQRWLDAAESYRLLENAGIVKTLARPRLDPQLLDALVNLGLHTDLQVNRLQPLFSGRRRWQMLEDRLPTSAFDYFRARGHRRDFSGLPIVDVPHAVAASVTTTTALIAAHEEGMAPITDARAHDELLRQRLRRAALEPSGLPDALRSDRPWTRNRVEKRLLGIAAPSAALRLLTMQDVIDYRRAHEDTRRQLARLIDRLTDEVRTRPWDLRLDDELEAIAEQILQMAADMPGLGSAKRAFADEFARPSLRLQVAAATSLTAYFSPNMPLLAGLAAGGLSIGGGVWTAAKAAVDELSAQRSPEQNALTYLQRAGR